jgi:hypothetical protein
MKYIVAGKLVNEPTPDQQERTRFTGGWRKREINGQAVMWNACVSPPFGGGDKYNF